MCRHCVFIVSQWLSCCAHLSSFDLWANADSVLSARKQHDQLKQHKLYNVIVPQHRQLSEFKAAQVTVNTFLPIPFKAEAFSVCVDWKHEFINVDKSLLRSLIHTFCQSEDKWIVFTSNARAATSFSPHSWRQQLTPVSPRSTPYLCYMCSRKKPQQLSFFLPSHFFLTLQSTDEMWFSSSNL